MKRGNTSKIAMMLLLIVAGGPVGAASHSVPALLAVEIDNLPERWEEIRGIPALARFQDRVLAGSGIAPEAIPALAGERAVVALVAGEDGRSAVPVLLLEPPDVERARSLLEGTSWVVRQAAGRLAVAPPGSGGLLDRLARSGLEIVAPAGTDWRFLPVDALARGRLDPAAIRDLLRSQVPGTLPPPLAWMAASVAAELEATRYVEFRREIDGNEVITEAVAGYDTGRLPPEVARILTPSASPPPVPGRLPDGVAAAGSFRPEGGACIPWLRFVSADDRRGALRNVEFWIGEIEGRTGRDLDRDLFGSLGEHGWWFVTGGGPTGVVGAVALMETVDERLLESTLVDLADWYAEHLAGRTLGLVAPRTVRFTVRGRPAHGLAFDTVLGDFRGPAFLVTDGHLLLATGEDALRAGMRILEERHGWTAQGSHGSLRLDGAALAGLLRGVAAGDPDPMIEAVIDLLGELDAVSVDYWYEEGSIRMCSRVRFR